MQPKHRLIRNRRFKLKPKYKMGDWNKDNTKRFWGYSNKTEMWVSPERFLAARNKMQWWK
jgi:hypothetical protein